MSDIYRYGKLDRVIGEERRGKERLYQTYF
jgi:hypothetical protein